MRIVINQRNTKDRGIGSHSSGPGRPASAGASAETMPQFAPPAELLALQRIIESRPALQLMADARAAQARAAASPEPVQARLEAAAQPLRTGPVMQFSPVDEARKQHEARGVEKPAKGGVVEHGSFQDMAEGDTGPTISHDHGFLEVNGKLDESLRQEPTWGDHVERLKWITKLELAEALRPDLVDGTSAYRHFLNGDGEPRDIEYGRFLQDDSSGQTVLASAIEDTRLAALGRHDMDVADAGPTEGTRTYRIRSGIINVDEAYARYPYPATENWQKAIGAHKIWIEADVTVTVTRLGDPASEPPTFSRSFEIEMTIHTEDMYNFKPGAADIATGIADLENGRFEITGLGHEYINRGTFTRSFEFTAPMDPVRSVAGTASPNVPGRSTRSGRPADRRIYATTR
jgi:hypothetical protein